MKIQTDELRQTADLVRAAQEGRPGRVRRTVRTIPANHFGDRNMRRLRNANDAQELVQDVFIQAMTKIDQLRTPECFIGWLRQITVRMAINKSVRRAPSVAVEPEILEATITQGRLTQSNVALAGERKGQVRDGIGSIARHGPTKLWMLSTFRASP